jgi:ketosteroid isomerase-like protein
VFFTTSDPLKLFDSFCEAIAKKDLNKMMSLFSEDATYEEYTSLCTQVIGKHALKPFMENQFRKIDEYKVKKLYTCEKKDSIVVEWVVNFKDPNTGKRNEIQGISVLETGGGKIQNWREYFKQ